MQVVNQPSVGVSGVFQEVEQEVEVPEKRSYGRDRCKWTVKSYTNGLETTWDVLETDGHLRSMRIVGKEPVPHESRSPQVAPERGPKSGLSTLSYSETLEDHSISLMRTVSSGTVPKEEEEERLREIVEGLEEDSVKQGSEESSPLAPSYPPPRMARTPSLPSRLEREVWPAPRRRVHSHDYLGLARQMSMDSERSLVTTPPGLFPSTPECEPNPASFMLPPPHLPERVVYVPVFMPHRCKHCGRECQPETITPEAWLSLKSLSVMIFHDLFEAPRCRTPSAAGQTHEKRGALRSSLLLARRSKQVSLPQGP